MFRQVIPELSQAAYVIAPDLPGFGESDVLPSPSFPAFGQAISELLDRLSIGPRYIYLHDYGVPAGFHIAMQAAEPVGPNRSERQRASNWARCAMGCDASSLLVAPDPGRRGGREAHLTSMERAIHTFPVLRRTWSRGRRTNGTT